MDKNVKVFCRFRPLNQSELNNGGYGVVRSTKNKNVYVQTENKTELSFNFDYIFPQQSTQEEIYQSAGKPLIDDIFKGYNTTIFAYGQSGSGKTTTMSGYSHVVDKSELLSNDDVILWTKPEDMGIVPRIIKDIFDLIPTKKDHQFSIQISYVEIYLEKIRDLLNPINDNLEIRESRYKGIWIDDVTEVYVSSFNDAIKIIRKGELNRSVASTAMNAHSSRSHSLISVNLSQINLKTQVKTLSRMVFVDLAGSEKVEKTKAEGLLLKQAQATNKSLLALGLVIKALVDKKSHVPYRDSKLTRLLTDSLGGNSKTHLILTCSLAGYNMEETISTLRFGTITQNIKNKPRVNLEMNVEEYKRLLQEAKEQIATQQLIIDAQQKDLNRLLDVCGKKGFNVKTLRRDYTALTKCPDESAFEDLEILSNDEISKKSTLITELQKGIDELKSSVNQSHDLNEILRDDLEHRQQDLEAKTLEFNEINSKYEDLVRMYDTLHRQLDDINETHKGQVHNLSTRIRELTDENILLKSSVALKGSYRTPLPQMKKEDSETPLLQKIETLLQTEEELRRELNGKTTHIQIIEESLQVSSGKNQELASEFKKKAQAYEKKIKDLESQVRILKSCATPTSNIVAPLKY